MRPPHDHDHDAAGHCVPGEANGPYQKYQRHGLRFSFPSNWNLTEESSAEETTITVQSDGTSFWMLVRFNSRPDAEEVLDSTSKAFEQDYEDVDVTSVIESLAGLPSLGRDLDFSCYDLLNSASIRVAQTSDHTLMVLFQGTDHELNHTRTQLEAISASLNCDDEEIDEDEG